VKNICTCAKAAGPSATRTSLVPLLLQHADDEDEVLFCLAKQLAELPPLLGGVEFATILIDPLERMASVEETVVRNQAVESLIHVRVGTATLPLLLLYWYRAHAPAESPPSHQKNRCSVRSTWVTRTRPSG